MLLEGTSLKCSASESLISVSLSLFCHSSPMLLEVKDLYLDAIQQNSDTIDPDLQTGLGVLYNLSSEFNKAVEAFNSALSVRPEVKPCSVDSTNKLVLIHTETLKAEANGGKKKVTGAHEGPLKSLKQFISNFRGALPFMSADSKTLWVTLSTINAC